MKPSERSKCFIITLNNHYDVKKIGKLGGDSNEEHNKNYNVYDTKSSQGMLYFYSNRLVTFLLEDHECSWHHSDFSGASCDISKMQIILKINENNIIRTQFTFLESFAKPILKKEEFIILVKIAPTDGEIKKLNIMSVNKNRDIKGNENTKINGVLNDHNMLVTANFKTTTSKI